MATEVVALPDDALAGVFRALPLQSLAVVRSVCKAWRDIVDARWLPLQHLLPRSVRGAFINYIDHDRPHHFARPCSSSTIPRVDGMLSFLPNNDEDWWSVLDHCNGLLLCNIHWRRELCVCNPATRRWTVLPHRRRADGKHLHHRYAGAYIAFDPAASPHYQVILVPHVPAKARRSLEWPPTPWALRVFSSRTGQWEERAFVREGMPAGTVRTMRLDPENPYGTRWRYAVYHNGSLYVHCRGSFVIRLSLANNNYQIIETPANIEYTKPYLGKLHNSVCFGIVHDHQLKIWILNESCGQMEWLLKYEAKVGHYAQYVASIPYDCYSGRQQDGSWIVEENNDTHNTDHNVESQSEESYKWDSDNDDSFNVDIESQEDSNDRVLAIMGFHPYKEVVFMVEMFGVVAYHLNSAKIQYLGNSRPKCYYRSHWNGVYESFLYTPCMIGHLLRGDQTS